MLNANETVGLPPVARTDDASLLRGFLFLAFFLLFWISVSPFQGTGSAPAGTQADSNVLNQASLLIAAAGSLLFMLGSNGRLALHLLSVPLVLTLAVLTLSTLASPDPGNSFKHVAFTVLIFITAAGCLFMPRDQRHFRSLLAIGALVVLTVCYLGVLLYPAAAVHHGGDGINELHDGAWRGSFRHKNAAGAAMAILVFVGIFVFQDGRRLLGAAIAASAGLFLLQTGSKTPAGLVVLVAGLTWILRKLSHTGLRLAFMAAVLTFTGLLTVGSANIDRIGALTQATLPDPTFTERTEVWRFAVERIRQTPWFGQGFRAFWNSPALVYGGYEHETWAHQATDGHNAYVDIALHAGIPALIVSLVWLVLQPIVDLKRSERAAPGNPMDTFFLHVWMYCIFAAFFESMFFSGGGGVWFLFVLAVFGLRMNGSAALVRS